MAPLSSQQLVAQFSNKPAPITPPTSGGSFAPAPTNGAKPITTSDLISHNKPKKTLVGKALTGIGNLFGSGIKVASGDIATAATANKNEKLYEQSLKTYSDTRNSLVKHIQTMQDAGQDTTEQNKTLASLDKTKPNLAQFTGGNINKTTGQVVGDVASGVMDVLPFVPGGAVADVAEQVGKGAVKKAAVIGAKEGTAYGASQGLAGALQKKQTPVKAAESVAIGGVTGGVAGAALGGGAAKLSDIISPSADSVAKKAASKLEDTTKAVSADYTPTKANKEGVENENPKGILGTIKRKYTEAEKSVAQTVSRIKGYKASDTFTKQLNTVKNGITDFAENTVKPFLKDNPVKFDAGEMEKYINNNVKPTETFKDNPKADTQYQKVINRGIDVVEDAIKKMTGNKADPLTDFNHIWDAAKDFDTAAEKERIKTTEGSDGRLGIETAVQDFHRTLRNFIADSLSNSGDIESVNKMTDFLNTLKEKGIDVPNTQEAKELIEKQFGINKNKLSDIKSAFFKHAMQEFANMYDAADNLGIKSAKESGTNSIGRFAKTPKGKAAIGVAKWAAGTGLAYEGIKHFTGGQ